MTAVATHGPALELPVFDDVLVVAAHPDDETLGCGGLVHSLHRARHRLTFVIASDGEAADPGLGVEERLELARIRTDESTRAIVTLAADAQIERLHLPDSAITEHEPAVEAALDALCTESTLVLAHHERDLHPDHEAVARAAGRVAARQSRSLLAYGIWMWHWPRTEADYDWQRARTFTLDAEDRRTKADAIACYRSQTADRSGDGPVVTAEMLDHHRGPTEVYFTSARA